MAGGERGVDAAIGVQQLDVQHGRVFAAHVDGPGVGNGGGVPHLVGIVNHDATERAVVREVEKGGAFFLAGILGGQQRRASAGGDGQARPASSRRPLCDGTLIQSPARATPRGKNRCPASR